VRGWFRKPNEPLKQVWGANPQLSAIGTVSQAALTPCWKYGDTERYSERHVTVPPFGSCSQPVLAGIC